jgi:hypothetical protein
MTTAVASEPVVASVLPALPVRSTLSKTVGYAPPEQFVIDGVDNDKEVDAYNRGRIKEKLKREDIDHIIANGVMNPVRIHVEGTGDDKVMVTDDGRQRIRRARAANELIRAHNEGKKLLPGVPAETKVEEVTVPFVVTKKVSDLESVIESIAMNQGRLEDSPRDLANAALWLHAQGADFFQISRALGRDTQTIREYLNLGNASSKTMKLLDEGAIDTTAACRLAQLPKDKQNDAIEKLAKEGKKVTKDRATTAAKKHKAQAKGKAPKQTDDKRSTRDMRILEKGLIAAIDEARKGTVEQAILVGALTLFRYEQGEEYPGAPGAKEAFAAIVAAFKAGSKIKAAEDKAKGRPAKASKAE